jgi:hypothetical protein
VHAYRSANYTTTAAGAYHEVFLNAEMFDVGSYYDTAFGRYTPPAGLYQLNGKVVFSGNPVGAWVVTLNKNGIEIARHHSFQATAGVIESGSVSVIAEANGSDYFTVRIYFDGAGTKTIHGGPSFSHLTAHQIS